MGFLSKAAQANGGKIDAGPLTLQAGNEYGALVLISLDGAPLAQSRKMILQVMTQEQPYGFKAPGGKIADLGGPPIGVKKIDMTLSINMPDKAQFKIQPLDANGYASGKPVANAAGEISGTAAGRHLLCGNAMMSDRKMCPFHLLPLPPSHPPHY